MFIALSIISVVLGIIFVFLASFFWNKWRNENLQCISGATAALLFIYAGTSILMYACWDTPIDELKRYEAAKQESEFLKKTDGIPYATVEQYTEDIKKVNEMIDDSRRWHDHWYLYPFFHKETAELEKISCDTVVRVALKL